MLTPAWVRALRRGSVPLVLGIACWIASIPAIEDLDPLLKWVGAILVALGLVIAFPQIALWLPGTMTR